MFNQKRWIRPRNDNFVTILGSQDAENEFWATKIKRQVCPGMPGMPVPTLGVNLATPSKVTKVTSNERI